MVDLQGRLHKERGILFETCVEHNHSAHGRVERSIRMVQESLERSGMKSSRCTATSWQTVSKAVEREVNSVPLGFIYYQGTINPLLRVLCPSLLKNSTFTDRAPKGLFSIPESPQSLMTKIEQIYNLWFKVWNIDYIPLIMDRQKWHHRGENLVENDLVYFKMTDTPLAADWRLGKVKNTKIGRDGLIREVGVSYKILSNPYDDSSDWTRSVVERPVRAIVKLFNIEDTTILEDMKKVHKLAKEILDSKKNSFVTDDQEEFEIERSEQDNLNHEETNERIEEIIDVSEQEEEEFYDVSPKPTNPKP